jgi:hypothetical protein
MNPGLSALGFGEREVGDGCSKRAALAAGREIMRYPFGILWIAFAVLWIVSPDTLGHVHNWIAGLPLILEIIVWIVFLPWVGALFLWHSGLALWLKIVLIVLIALVTTGGVGARRASKQRRRDWNRWADR